VRKTETAYEKIGSPLGKKSDSCH